MIKRFRVGAGVAGLIFALAFSVCAETEWKAGGDLRLRHEYWKNFFDMENGLKDNRNFFRTRYRLWGETKFEEDVRIYTRLTSEFKNYTYFPQSSGKKRPSFDSDEVVIDNLYVDIKEAMGSSVDLRLGRQDFLGIYGEGFLIMDGTPLDGSRTTYFNAAKASWKVDDVNTVDFIYIYDPRTDDFLPIISANSPEQALNLTDETGFVAYWKNNSVERLSLEPYYIFKTEDDVEGSRLQAEDSKIHAIGLFSKYEMAPWTLRGQGAFQTGNYGDHDRQAFGGYVFADRAFDNEYHPKWTSGVIYLSGDDPDSQTNEGWDPLFSRWPWMSELVVVNYNGESGMGYWTNTVLYHTQLQLSLNKRADFTLGYNFLQALETPASTAFALGSGKNRGHLPQARAGYKFSDHISGYVLAEYFIPGNFYSDAADEALFLRTEISIKF